MSVISLTEARNNLPKLVKQVDEVFERVTITVNGTNKATIISPEEIDAYEETIMTLSDSEVLHQLVGAEAAYEAGETYDFDEVFSS